MISCFWSSYLEETWMSDFLLSAFQILSFSLTCSALILIVVPEKEYKKIIFGAFTSSTFCPWQSEQSVLTRSNKCTFFNLKCNWRLTHSSSCVSPAMTPDALPLFHSCKLCWYIEYLFLQISFEKLDVGQCWEKKKPFKSTEVDCNYFCVL